MIEAEGIEGHGDALGRSTYGSDQEETKRIVRSVLVPLFRLWSCLDRGMTAGSPSAFCGANKNVERVKQH